MEKIKCIPGSEMGKAFVRVIPIPMLILLALGALLRVYRIDSAEMWTDEMTYVLWSKMSIPEFFHSVTGGGTVHLPGYPILLHAFAMCFGDSETAYRSSTLLLGLLSILAIYHTGRRLFSEEVGWISAVLLTFLPYGVYLSQEIAPYSQVALTSLLVVWSFFRAWETNRWRDWFLFAAMGLWASYTYIFTVFVLITVYAALTGAMAWTMIRRTANRQCWSIYLKAVVMGFVMLAAFSPVLPYLYRGISPENAGKWGGFSSLSFLETIFTVLRTFVFDHSWSLALSIVLGAIGSTWIKERRSAWITSFAIVCTFLLPLYLTYSQGYTFRVRHYTYAMPFVLILMACGIAQIRHLLCKWLGPRQKEDSTFAGISIALSVVLLAWPSAHGLYQFYLIRATQATLFSSIRQGAVEKRLLQEPMGQQMYSKTVVPEYRELAALLMRNMEPGDILIVDNMTISDLTGRGLTYHLNSTYKLDIPTGGPFVMARTMKYDPHRITLMVSNEAEPCIDSIQENQIPPHGVRVYRVSQRYYIGDIPGTTQIALCKLRMGVSSTEFTNAASLLEYLQQNIHHTQACDMLPEDESTSQEELEPIYRKSLDLAWNSTAAGSLGGLLLTKANFKDAESLLALAVVKQPSRWEWWFKLAKARDGLGLPQEALSAYVQAWANPNAQPYVGWFLAKAYEAAKDAQNARSVYAELSNRTSDPTYLVSRALVWLVKGKPELTINECLAFLDQHPNMATAHLALVQGYRAIGETAKAFDHADQAVRCAGDDINMLISCSRAYTQLGAADKAEALIRDALKQHPDQPDLQKAVKAYNSGSGQ